MSRYDVRQALARIEQQEVSAVVEGLVDRNAEARLLGAMLCNYPLCTCAFCPDDNARALALCDDVELDDFTDLRYRAAFVSLRKLQANGESTEPWAVSEEIDLQDVLYGKHVGESVDITFLTELAICHPKHSRASLAHAQRRLRELANLRRLA